MPRGLAVSSSIEDVLRALASLAAPPAPQKVRAKFADLMGNVRRISIKASREYLDVTGVGDNFSTGVQLGPKQVIVEMSTYIAGGGDPMARCGEELDFEYATGGSVIKGVLLVRSVQIVSAVGQIMECEVEAVSVGPFSYEPIKAPEPDAARGIALTGVE